jgi:hypothetical protein
MKTELFIYLDHQQGKQTAMYGLRHAALSVLYKFYRAVE